MSALTPMSPDQAEAIYASGKAAVVEVLCRQQADLVAVQQQNELLGQKVTLLEQEIVRLSKDSSTSHKPPSSDITRPPRQDKPGRGKAAGKRPDGAKRKPGGQPGHPKHNRALLPTEVVDRVQHYGLGCCPRCDSEEVWLVDAEPRVQQQVELRELVWQVEEHRAYAYYCSECEGIQYAEFPEAVVKEGLFKERLTALVAYMKHVCHASFSTIRKFLRDVLGVPVSRGYLAKLLQKVSAALEEPYTALLERLPLETKLNVDETGHKENGERFWTWVFKAELYVLFRIDKSRGSAVLIEVLGKEFEGVLGCDYFSAYRKYMTDFNALSNSVWPI